MNKKLMLSFTLILAAALVLSACSLLPFSKTPVAASNVLFSDDFSKTSSGWDKASGTEGFTDYQDGAYHISVTVANYDLWANPSESFTDTSVEVDATLVSGTEDNDMGVLCRYQDTSNYYFAEIASDGYYGIGKVVAGTQNALTDGFPATDLVKSGVGTTNHMRVDCVGNTITLYINGTQAASVTDSEFSSGDVGLIAGTYDTPGVEVAFDNFVVSKP
jgi:pectate lyase